MSIDEALQREYDNRAKVPDFAAILERWGQAAAAFRTGHQAGELDLRYGPSARQTLDIFWPAPDRGAPIALFLHGGYWQSLDKNWFSHLAAGLNGQGIAVAIPNYDLCPQISLAALVEQIRDLACWMYRRHARKMLSIGHSAGGHLTAMLLATEWTQNLPDDLVPAGLAISGLFDLTPLLATSINTALQLSATEARNLSPVRLPSPGRALHAMFGAEEGPEYARQSRDIAAAWDGNWEAVPGADHFSILNPLIDANSAMVRRAAAMISW
jgi:arylformamidase